MKNKYIIAMFALLTLTSFNPLMADKIEDAKFLYNDAIDMYSQNNVQKSIEMFQKAIDLYPDFYEANYNLAQILMSIEENEKALIPLEKIVSLQPQNYEAIYNIARIQYKRGYLSKSFEALNKIPKSAPQFESAKLLLSKIEKRQDELVLEKKLQEHESVSDAQGKILAVELNEISTPSGIALDERGNIYVASFLENTIYKISAFGQKTVFSNSALIKGPIGLAIDKKENIYVANYSSNNIVKFTKDGAAKIFADINKPYYMIYDKEHDRLYVSEQNTNKLVKFDL